MCEFEDEVLHFFIVKTVLQDCYDRTWVKMKGMTRSLHKLFAYFTAIQPLFHFKLKEKWPFPINLPNDFDVWLVLPGNNLIFPCGFEGLHLWRFQNLSNEDICGFFILLAIGNLGVKTTFWRNFKQDFPWRVHKLVLLTLKFALELVVKIILVHEDYEKVVKESW